MTMLDEWVVCLPSPREHLAGVCSEHSCNWSGLKVTVLGEQCKVHPCQ